MKLKSVNGPLILAAAVATLLAACSPEQKNSTTGAQPASVAIQGEPIKPLAQAPVTVSANPAGSIPVPASAAATATAPAVANSPAPQTIHSGDQDYLTVGFDQLASYTFEMSDDLIEAKGDLKALTAKTNGQIPEKIRGLNEKTVAVKGYMLPLKVEQGAVSEFLLMRDQSMCCFGTVPKINDWVSVKTTGKGVKPVMDEPVTIFGRLHVGEIRENGYLVGIYRMDGEKLAGPLDL